MKAKYRLNDLIKFTVTGGSDTGTVTAVIKRAAGYSYLVEEGATEVSESDVLTSYLERTSRSTSTTKKKRAKRAKGEGVTLAAA